MFSHGEFQSLGMALLLLAAFEELLAWSGWSKAPHALVQGALFSGAMDDFCKEAGFQTTFAQAPVQRALLPGTVAELSVSGSP